MSDKKLYNKFKVNTFTKAKIYPYLDKWTLHGKKAKKKK